MHILTTPFLQQVNTECDQNKNNQMVPFMLWLISKWNGGGNSCPDVSFPTGNFATEYYEVFQVLIYITKKINITFRLTTV